MLQCLKLFSFIGIVSLLMACGAKKDTEESMGDDAASVVSEASFTTLNGDSVHISDYAGKVVLIDFWETWCKPCLASFPTLEKLEKEYPEDFAVLAVTPGFTDTRRDAQTFVENNDYTFQFLMDSNGLHEKLGVQGIPYKVFVDAEGEYIQATMGSYGNEQDYQKIKAIIEEHRLGKQQAGLKAVGEPNTGQ